jgi:opacity protein-like surface antigen
MTKWLFSLQNLIVIYLVLMNMFVLSNRCNAQIEAYVIGQQMQGDNTTISDTKLNIANSIVGGLGAGVNIDNFNLNLDFLFGSTEIKMENSKIDCKLFVFDANIDYAFLKDSFSPIITVGIGSVNFTDSFVAYEKLNETDFSYNLGAGFRYVLQNHFLLKGTYRATWTKIQDTDSSIMLNGIRVELGYIFKIL